MWTLYPDPTSTEDFFCFRIVFPSSGRLGPHVQEFFGGTVVKGKDVWASPRRNLGPNPTDGDGE